jgi:glycosyltransferase involved in cell wall biosynthesis
LLKKLSIDIVIPFYGDPKLFREAVESVLAQSDPDWHLTVVDDVYTDRAPGEWLVGLADRRITYIRNETNLGVNGNFDKCAQLASADIASIIGCDDALLPNYVARVRSMLTQYPTADYVQPGVRVMDSEGHEAAPLADRVKAHYRPKIARPTLLGGEHLAQSLLRGNWTYFPSIAWRTIRLKRHGFRQDLEVVLDLALQIDIVVEDGWMVLDTEPSFRYRRHAASVSSWTADDGSRFIEEGTFFAECAERMRVLGWNRAARIARWHFSSRLNALTRVPASVKASDRDGVSLLVRYAFRLPAKRRIS